MNLVNKYGEICVNTLKKLIKDEVVCEDMSIIVGDKKVDIDILSKDGFEMFAKVIKYIVQCNEVRKHVGLFGFLFGFVPFIHSKKEDIKYNLCLDFINAIGSFGNNSVSKVWQNENNINVVSIDNSTVEIHYYCMHGYPTINIVVSEKLVCTGVLNPKYELIQLYDYYNNKSLI